ncbi:GATA transcription factor 27-like isoform X2 [Rutidosis leptorrhynchoides]|uniref:GATA transcription factor 27-like isoform X2 n=1 Tax=Rutidosis leptorrhynchoides TaxID=125765 RepID=UPI003A98DF35
MGKQGPCYHCGVTSTPLWRNGPPEKPVLCNACGSRWRTKGSLVNYTPLHSRAELDDLEDRRGKIISIKNKESKVVKRKHKYDNVMGGTNGIMLVGNGGNNNMVAYDQHFRKVFDEDNSNRSSSGSAISYSDGSYCMQPGSVDASDLTGPAQSSVVWERMVPSRKRSCVKRLKQSSVEKLTKDLHTILHEQQSYFSASSEDDLIFESETPMVSVEIGHGSVLMRHPNSTTTREEESEASSVSVDTKNEAYSRLTTVYNANDGGNFSSRRVDTSKKSFHQDYGNRDNDEMLQILVNHNSPLCHIDLKDVINFEEFASHLTNEEQQQLHIYLTHFDTVQGSDSLKSMFNSPQFKENLSSFQKLLAEGVFDLSSPVVNIEDCKTLKKLAVCSATKSDWVEKYNLLQDNKCTYDSVGGSIVDGLLHAVTPRHSVNVTRSRDPNFQPYPGSKPAMKDPKRTLMKSSYEQKEHIDNDGPGFSPRSLFALPPDNSSLMLDDSLRYTDQNCDQDMLLNVPFNTSFPQAEILRPTSSFEAAAAHASTSSSSIYQN